jgi:hypothetical protein
MATSLAFLSEDTTRAKYLIAMSLTSAVGQVMRGWGNERVG